MTDEEIVGLVQKGDKEKFGEIFDRYWGKLFGYLKNITNRSKEEVEDLVSETIIKTYENINSFDPKKKFSSWIYRIAHNTAVDAFKKYRKGKVDLEENEELIGDGKKLFEDLAIENEEKEKLNKSIEQLEVKYKEVIWLYYFEDKDYEEMSEILRVPTNNVGVMLYRAKEKLKKVVSKLE